MMPEVVELLGASLRGSVLVARAAWVEGAFLDRALAPLRERVPNGVVDTAMTTAVLLLVLPPGWRPNGAACAPVTWWI